MRGLIGKLFSFVFWAFNVIMVVWIFAAATQMGDLAPTSNEAEQAGRNIGVGIAFVMIIFIWAAGVVVFGALSFFTRGKKLIISETTEERPL